MTINKQYHTLVSPHTALWVVVAVHLHKNELSPEPASRLCPMASSSRRGSSACPPPQQSALPWTLLLYIYLSPHIVTCKPSKNEPFSCHGRLWQFSSHIFPQDFPSRQNILPGRGPAQACVLPDAACPPPTRLPISAWEPPRPPKPSLEYSCFVTCLFHIFRWTWRVGRAREAGRQRAGVAQAARWRRIGKSLVHPHTFPPNLHKSVC